MQSEARVDGSSTGAMAGQTAALTQLVVDVGMVGAENFAVALTLCLGDVVAVDARWIWDPRRACPLNLAAARLAVESRWDTNTIVALRKGGFHKIRSVPGSAPTGTVAAVQTKGGSEDPGAHSRSDEGQRSERSGVADAQALAGVGQEQDGWGVAGLPAQSAHARGGKPRQGRRVITSKRLPDTERMQSGGGGDRDSCIGSGGEDGDEGGEAHGGGGAEGAKDRARKMCSWILAKMGAGGGAGAGGDGDGVVLDVAGGAGYLALQLSRHGIAVTIVDPRPPRPFNRWGL